MPSSYSSNLRLELIGSGEQAGAWGNTTNNNLGTLLDEAIAGVLTVSIPTDANYTLTVYNGSSDQARQAALIITSAVTLTAVRNLIIPNKDKVYIIKNSTTGGQSINVKTASVTGVTIPNGQTYVVYCDSSTGIVATINTAQESSNVTSYNNKTGEVTGIDTLIEGKGIQVWTTAEDAINNPVGTNTIENTGVTSLKFLNANAATTGAIVIEAADITATLKYTPPKPDGTGASGNWAINADTATKFKGSLGDAPAIATRAWVNFTPPTTTQFAATTAATGTTADKDVTLSQTSGTVATVTVSGFTTKTGTYTQSSVTKTPSYYTQGTTVTGSTYKIGSAVKSGTYTKSGTTVTVSITSHGLVDGQTMRATIGALIETKVITYINANSYKYTSTTSGSGSGSISMESSGSIVTVTKTAHGLINGTLINVAVLTGSSTEGPYTITLVDSDTFTYTNPNNKLATGGTLTYIKPSTLITVKHTAHGLTNGDSIKITSVSTGSAVVDQQPTVTVTDVNTFTYISTSTALTAYSTTNALTYVSKGTIVTVTCASHGLLDFESVYMNITGGGSESGVKQIYTVPTTSTFTYTSTNSLFVQSGGAISFVNDGVAVGQQIWLATTNFGSASWYTVQSVTSLSTFTISRTATIGGIGTGILKRSVINSGANIAYVSCGGGSPTSNNIINYKAPMYSVNYCINTSSSYPQYPPYAEYSFSPNVHCCWVKCVYSDAFNNSKYNYVSIVQ